MSHEPGVAKICGVQRITISHARTAKISTKLEVNELYLPTLYLRSVHTISDHRPRPTSIYIEALSSP